MINKISFNNEKIDHFIIFISIILFLMIFHGCAYVPYKAYSETSISKEKIAKISGKIIYDEKEYNPANPKILFLKVDNIKTFSYVIFMGDLLNFSSFVDEVHLAPGKHNILVRYDDSGVFAYANLWFVAEEGKEYTVVATIRKKGWSSPTIRIVIIENVTGNLVGGVTGSADEPKG
jgi:hypothetical protein